MSLFIYEATLTQMYCTKYLKSQSILENSLHCVTSAYLRNEGICIMFSQSLKVCTVGHGIFMYKRTIFFVNDICIKLFFEAY